VGLYREFLKLDKGKAVPAAGGDAATAETRLGFVNLSKDIFIPPLMYIRKEGYAVSAASYEDITPLNGAVHCVLVWTDPAESAERLRPLSRITRTGAGTAAYAPVIVMADESSPARLLRSEIDNISFVNRSIDLRLLDAHILEQMARMQPRAA
jgi:hypothetical protein